MSAFRQHYTPPAAARRQRAHLVVVAIGLAAAICLASGLAAWLSPKPATVAPVDMPRVQVTPLPPLELLEIRREAFRIGYEAGAQTCGEPILQLPLPSGRRS